MICRFWNHRNPVLVVMVLRLRYTFRWVEHNSPHSPFSSSYSTFFPPNDENHGWYDFLNHQNSLWTIFPERRRRVTSSRLDYENIHMSWCNWINFLKSVWWLFPKVLPILALKCDTIRVFHNQYQFFWCKRLFEQWVILQNTDYTSLPCHKWKIRNSKSMFISSSHADMQSWFLWDLLLAAKFLGKKISTPLLSKDEKKKKLPRKLNANLVAWFLYFPLVKNICCTPASFQSHL